MILRFSSLNQSHPLEIYKEIFVRNSRYFSLCNLNLFSSCLFNLKLFLAPREGNSKTAGYQLASKTKFLSVLRAEWLKCQICKNVIVGSILEPGHFVLYSF